MECYQQQMNESDKRTDILTKLPLFDRLCGDNGVVCSFDDQHNGKNHRAKIIRLSGFMIHRISFYRLNVIGILHIMTGDPTSKYDSLFPPSGVDDHQNVSSMVKGFAALASLWGKTPDDAHVTVPEQRKPGLAQQLLELQPLAFVGRCWVFLFTSKDGSLADHVENAARLATSLFIIRRHNKKSLPAQLYTATVVSVMRLIKDILACQQKGYRVYYIFIAATHLLEQCFGVLRTLCPSQRNFDCLQIEERMSSVVRLRAIYERHPDWKDDPRRISQSFDHWNAHSWLGDVDPSNVNIINSWYRGVYAAAEALSALPFYDESETDIDAIIANNPLTTLLNPSGTPSRCIASDDEDEVILYFMCGHVTMLCLK